MFFGVLGGNLVECARQEDSVHLPTVKKNLDRGRKVIRRVTLKMPYLSGCKNPQAKEEKGLLISLGKRCSTLLQKKNNTFLCGVGCVIVVEKEFYFDTVFTCFHLGK